MALSRGKKWLAGTLVIVFVLNGVLWLFYINLFNFLLEQIERETDIIIGPSPAVEWSIDFNIAEETEGIILMEDNDGSYLMAGIARSREYWETSQSDASSVLIRYLALMKFDADGEILWFHKYDIPVRGILSMTRSEDGGYCIAGKKSGTDETFILKTDAGGEKEYLKMINTEKSRGIVAGVSDGDSFVFTGRIDPQTSFCIPDQCQCGKCGAVFIISVDLMGAILWEKVIEELSYLTIRSFCVSSRGSYVIAGTNIVDEIYHTRESGAQEIHWKEVLYELKIYKINSDGFLEWDKVINADLDYRPQSALVEVEESLLVSYTPMRTHPDHLNTTLVKVDNQGKLLWEINVKKHAGNIIGTGSGGCIMVGTSKEAGKDGMVEYPYICEIGPTGRMLWEKSLESSSEKELDDWWGPFAYSEIIYCSIETSDGGYIVTGRRDEVNDPYLLKLR